MCTSHLTQYNYINLHTSVTGQTGIMAVIIPCANTGTSRATMAATSGRIMRR